MAGRTTRPSPRSKTTTTPPPRGRRGSKGRSPSSAMVEHWAAQNAQYLGPWLVCLLAGFAGQLLHGLAATSSMVLVVVGVTLATLAVGYGAWHTTKDREPVLIGHTLATIAVGGFWMALCTASGLVSLEWLDWWPVFPLPVFHRPTVDLYCILALALGATWNLRQGQRVFEAHKAAVAEKTGEPEDAWAMGDCAGVKGRIRPVNEYKDEGTLTLPRGMTLLDLQKNLKKLESAHDWPPDSAIFIPHPRWKRITSRKVKATIMRKDPLEGDVVWPAQLPGMKELTG